MFFTNDIVNGRAIFSPEMSTHIVKVLRHREGSKISFTDGEGTLYSGSLTNADPKKVEACVTGSRLIETTLPLVHIVVAPTKNIDRIEWFVEKAVEVGVSEISFIETKNSERKVLKTDRLHKIAVSAMLQSQQVRLPKINEMLPLKKFIENTAQFTGDKFFGYCYDGNIYATSEPACETVLETQQQEQHNYTKTINPNHPAMVLIGPEGDFTAEEACELQSNNFKPVVFSNTRLRTETAALYASWAYKITDRQ